MATVDGITKNANTGGFGKQVGDGGPILDMMAVALENISTVIVVARTTITAVYRVAQIIASIPNLSYHNKASQHNLLIFFF